MARYLFLLALCCLAVGISPGYTAGTTSAPFLKLGIGAKNVAMGETGAAETDVNAIYWNPAGLSRIDKSQVSFMHAAWLDGVTFQNVSYAQKFTDSAVGISATYLSVPSIDKYDNTGIRQNASYQPNDLALILSYGRDVRDLQVDRNIRIPHLPFGVNLKYISSTIDGQTATAFAADAGVNFLLSRAFALGVVVQNIGSSMKFEKESFGLPLNVKAGILFSPVEQWNFALDLNKPVDNDLQANAGAQYLFHFGSTSSLAARLGYKTGVKGLEGVTGATAGLGFNFQGLGIDYAFVPYGEMDNTQRISLRYAF